VERYNKLKSRVEDLGELIEMAKRKRTTASWT
jgi:hypothetical protein